MSIEQRFTEQAARELREAIREADGNEVFAAAWLDAELRVHRLAVNARGNSGAVPAIYDGASRQADETPDVLIHNHPGGFLTPSDNDLVIASRAAGQGIGSYIVDNDVRKVYVVAEPVVKRRQSKLDGDEISARLEAGGAIAAKLPQYEKREPQLALLRLVVRAFNEDCLAAAEAGTGVGKSFAYLLPAMAHADANGERVVISTATINLQQQLFEKDIPLVNSVLENPVKAVLVKGRGNYICKRRLRDALGAAQLELDFAEREAEFRALEKWAETTATGSRSELSFVPDGGLWGRLCSDADNCMGMRCPERETCFVMAVRREAADARVLVVNHHLLFADLAARKEGAGYDGAVVLPPYRRVIIDEAHKIEGSATSFFTGEFGIPGLYRQLGRLFRQKGAQKGGLLVRLGACAGVNADGEEAAVAWQVLSQEVKDAADDLNKAGLEVCGEESVFRLIPERDGIIAERLVPHLETTRRLLLRFAEKAAAVTEAAEEKLGDAAKSDDTVWELKAVLRRLRKLAEICGGFIEYREHPLDVLWIERRHSARSGDDWALFSIAPVNIAEQLKEALFEANRTVACVSATLAVSGSFNYWMGRTGIARSRDEAGDAKAVLSGNFPSPFPYESAVLLAVPTDAPAPADREFAAFTADAVFRLARSSGGGALVLFTSFESLRSAYAGAAGRLQRLGIRCMKQGDDDRSRLLRDFLADGNGVLFATDSFWEGVDAPGSALRLVIMCRLPFKAPNDPVFEARCESVEKAGGNSFMDMSVPEAVMKFRQGFGRLIRRSGDRGAVVVLDSRLLTKRYGALFLRSLPKTRTRFAPLSAIEAALTRNE